MDVTKIAIKREDLNAIMEAMNKFPEAMDAKLMHEEDETDYTLTLGIMTTVAGMTGRFYVPIAKGKVTI